MAFLKLTAYMLYGKVREGRKATKDDYVKEDRGRMVESINQSLGIEQ